MKKEIFQAYAIACKILWDAMWAFFVAGARGEKVPDSYIDRIAALLLQPFVSFHRQGKEAAILSSEMSQVLGEIHNPESWEEMLKPDIIYSDGKISKIVSHPKVVGVSVQGSEHGMKFFIEVYNSKKNPAFTKQIYGFDSFKELSEWYDEKMETA